MIGPQKNATPRRPANEDWCQRAACLGVETEIFFYQRADEALRICADCPVRQECRDYADHHEKQVHSGYMHGVYGGENAWSRVFRRKAEAATL